MIVQHFRVWITCLLPQYQDYFIVDLVKKGYAVASAVADAQIAWGTGNNPAALIVLNVVSSKENTGCKDVHVDLESIVLLHGLYVYSVVIVELTTGTCSWSGPNITVSKAPALPALTPKVDGKLN